jgi:hypothetical protein
MKMDQLTLAQNEVLAIVGEQIKENDVAQAAFPDSTYHKGQRDALVNLMVALRKAFAKN